MSEVVLTVTVVLAFTVVLTVISLKKKNSSWSGVLEDKKKSSYRDDNDFVKETYTLIFRTDEGKKVKIQVNEKMFNEFDQNGRYIKKKGEYIPTKA